VATEEPTEIRACPLIKEEIVIPAFVGFETNENV
jgi:hypothetical protein